MGQSKVLKSIKDVLIFLFCLLDRTAIVCL
nr:MAG TPA: hypothetical protein [Bacteriophage sp.]